MPNEIRESLLKLENFIIKAQYRGFDPYDALTSPLFRLPVLKSNHQIRFFSQQFVKRFPINLRPLLLIPEGYNPVTLALCLQAYTYLSYVFPEKQTFYQREIDRLIIELERLQCKGYSGACWGYDFDWEGRYAPIPANVPTVVATGFVTNALFQNYKLSHNVKSFELCKSSVQFILNDLNKTYQNDTFCYSYSPLDKQIVFNGTMKGARTLVQVYSVSRDKELFEEARKTVTFVMNYQTKDGAWSYAHGDARKWSDNYHTGYIIDCLNDYINLSGDTQFIENRDRAYHYFVHNFIKDKCIPKFYDKHTFPIDCTAAAQSILTLIRFGQMDLAVNISEWMIQNMQTPQGYFYFRKFKYYTIKTSFIRWSNAWMFVALSFLLYHLKQEV